MNVRSDPNICKPDSQTPVKAVVFDCGGVLFEESSKRAFAKLHKKELLMYGLSHLRNPKGLRSRFLQILLEMDSVKSKRKAAEEILLRQDSAYTGDLLNGDGAAVSDSMIELSNATEMKLNIDEAEISETDPRLSTLPATYKSSVLPQILVDWLTDRYPATDILNSATEFIGNYNANLPEGKKQVSKAELNLLGDIAKLTLNPPDLAEIMVPSSGGVRLLALLHDQIKLKRKVNKTRLIPVEAHAPQLGVQVDLEPYYYDTVEPCGVTQLYLLSNYNTQAFNALATLNRENQQIFQLFDDIILSGGVRCIKPGRRIYEIAQERWALPRKESKISDSENRLLDVGDVSVTAAHKRRLERFLQSPKALRETKAPGSIVVYIDDSPENIEMATKEFGWYGIIWDTANNLDSYVRAVKILESLGVL